MDHQKAKLRELCIVEIGKANSAENQVDLGLTPLTSAMSMICGHVCLVHWVIYGHVLFGALGDMWPCLFSALDDMWPCLVWCTG